MNSKDLLAKAVEIITFLFAAFGGFLKQVAPPEEANAQFAVGASSILALIALLFVTAVAKQQARKKYKKIWLAASLAFFLCAVIATFFYKQKLDELTFPYPPENTRTEYVRGTVFTSEAESYRVAHPEKTISEIVGDYGGLADRELVWTPESIRSAKLQLTVTYVILVLTLATAIFSLVEGVLAGPTKRAPAKKHDK